ncbi:MULTISPECIES: YdgA family protein [unclassified Paludibacterium]|uniref:YdgA family protein n=1 Tax=unclassified Paludibacterium TaxID=2618429 RepID=UPI001C04ECED|nr:YdgA family protein [Paludibacterium sp. B53371]BEV71606.1 YdgA family protein [Paludibacterium sp. THUN1379]
MLQKQRLTFAAAALGGLFVLYGGAAYWAGIKAEDTLEQQHRMLASLPLFKVKSHTYERGWFSSQETTELVFNRRLTGPYEGMLPDNIRPMLGATIRFTNTVKHGPFPGLGSFDLRPARALVTTRFDMSDSTRKTLALFFGDKEPITVVNRLGFGGGGELKVDIPAFDYEEALSGVKVKWKGFSLAVDYQQGFKQYQTEANSPSFSLEAASKGTIHFDGVRYVSDIRPGSTGVKLGTSELTVSNVQLNWKDSIPYSIKLNDLVYLLTRMHVGEFINPSGEFKPSSVTLKGLHYQIVTSEEDPYINSRGKLGFDTFSYNDQVYGPMRLDVSANHLHGPTLVKLDQAISQLPIEGMDAATLRKSYISTIKKYGIPLLENDPRLVVNDFYLKMPSGEATLKGQLALKGFREADLKDPLQVLRRFQVAASVSLPRQTLENLVVTQARNLFTVDQSAEDQPNLNEIDDLAKNLLDSQLAQWADQGFIQVNKGQINTSIDYHDGALSVSHKRVALPWEEKDDPAGPGGSAK